jgi:hypothetical protein
MEIVPRRESDLGKDDAGLQKQLHPFEDRGRDMTNWELRKGTLPPRVEENQEITAGHMVGFDIGVTLHLLKPSAS